MRLWVNLGECWDILGVIPQIGARAYMRAGSKQNKQQGMQEKLSINAKTAAS